MRFCGNCGTALRTAGAEERKLVTIVFIDLVDSSRFAAAADPEQWREQVARFFVIVRQEIERFGGTVEKFIGDAVMAVFGLPTVHEDDAERSVRAAAAVRPRLQPLRDAGRLPDIRIGIQTGEVIANAGASDKGEFLVTGETVNLAARLQQHASPGQTLLGERTAAAVRHAARLRPIPPLSVKGAASPVSAWELIEVLPPRERDLQPTPFVGREDELELLAGHVRRIRRDGRGHVVTILGAGGVGKTRLVAEFRVRTRDIHALRGRALPYGTGVPFWSLGETIREECGILFGDPLDAARRKVDETVGRLGVPGLTAPALKAVLALGTEGLDLTRDALFAGMRAFFEALARRDPLLLILEDVHSAEDVTLDFIEHAADWVRESPIMLVILSRPELLERRPSWLGGKRSATTLFLDPLGLDESQALALGILGGNPAPDGFVQTIIERAGGNPLFMEEMLRALIEQGVLVAGERTWTLSVPADRVAIPDTVHAVIAARIDALPPPEKHVLQAAAVEGKDFWRGALGAITQEANIDSVLETLVSKDLVTRKPTSTLMGEDEFTFRHILIRDVAYTMLPKAQRWPRHALHAEWLRRMAGDRHAEFADFISHHWLQVLAIQRELGVPPDPAATAEALANLLLAGDRAAGVYANAIALDHYARALDLDPPSTERLRALKGRGEVWMLLGQFERAQEDFVALQTLAQRAGDRRWEIIALDDLGHSYRRQDRIPQALENLQRGLDLSRKIGEPVLTARILNHIGFSHYSAERHDQALQAHAEARGLLAQAVQSREVASDLAESLHGLGENYHYLGRFAEAIEHHLLAIAASERAGNRSLGAESEFMIAHAHLLLGEYARAHAEVQRSLATLDEIGDVWNSCPALHVASRIATAQGNLGTAIALATKGASLARQLDVVRFRAYNLMAAGIAFRELEDYQAAWQADQEAVDVAARAGGAFVPLVLAGMARNALALGRLGDASEFILRARDEISRSQTRLEFLESVTHAEGHVWLAQGRVADAAAAAHAALDAAASGARHWTMAALLLAGDCAAATGEWHDAAQRYRHAAERASQTMSPPSQWRALAGLAETQHAVGHREAASAAAQSARNAIERIAATVPDERARATFLQSARVQRVVTLSGA